MLYNHLSVNFVEVCYFFIIFHCSNRIMDYLLAGEAERFSAEYKRDNGGLIYLK